MAGRFPPEPLKAVVEEVASLLKARKETVSVVETAAGGLISAALLATPGASTFYKGGLTVCHASSALFVLYGGFRSTNTLCGLHVIRQRLQW
jgi:Competence-damaged protein